MSDWWESAKLDPDALGLTGRDLEVARVISEETEAERERRFAALPPLTPEELAKPLYPSPALPLLGGPGLLGNKTVGEARRAQIDGIKWDSLLCGTPAHSACVERTGIGYSALIQFVLEKCQPPNWEAVFWYRAWLSEALTDKFARKDVDDLLSHKQAESAATERRVLASQGGAAKAAKYKAAEDWTVSEWQQFGHRWDTKKKFAESYMELVKDRYDLDVRVSTITDKWLSPSRLAGK